MNEADIAPHVPHDEQELSASIFAQFLEAKLDRLPYDDQWWVSWAWYHGRTDVFFDPGITRREGQVYQIVHGRARHRRTRPINLIGHAIDLTVAKQMRARPTFDTAPGSRNDAKDRLAARAARDLVRHLWLVRDLTARRRELFLDRCITGNSFLKVRYDRLMAPFRDDIAPCEVCGGAGSMPLPPEAVMMHQQLSMQAMQLGLPVQEPQPMPCPVCQGQGQINRGRVPMGDVDISIVPPWEVYPIVGMKKVTQGMFHAYPMDRKDAAAAYGLGPEEVGSSGSYEETVSHFARLARMHRVSDLRLRKEQVMVIERWLPPLPNSERPRLSILVGNRLAWPKQDNPTYAEGYGEIGERYNRIPFFHFRLRPCAEEFWSAGIVLDMIPSNDFVNRARANFHRHQDVMAYTKWLVEKGSVDKDALTNEVGEVVEFWGSDPPTQRAPAPMPEFYVRLSEKEEDNIPKLAGLQEVDQGRAPPNIEAFQALHFLAEQSETVHGPVLLEDESQWRQTAQAALICAVHNYEPQETRMIRVSGSASKVEVRALLSSDLSDSVDVQCEIGSALAHSQALRQEQVMNALKVGIIQPQEARRLMEWGIMLGEDDDDHRIQESVAELENVEMKNGGQHTILQGSHNHEIHIAIHRRAALEAQVDGRMDIAAVFEQAVQEHMTIEQQQQQPQQPGASGTSQMPPGAANTPFDNVQSTQNYEGGAMSAQGQ